MSNVRDPVEREVECLPCASAIWKQGCPLPSILHVWYTLRIRILDQMDHGFNVLFILLIMERKSSVTEGVDLSEGSCASNSYGSLSPFLQTCHSRDKIPTLFHFRMQRRPAHIDEVKEKQCPPGDLYRLRDVGNLILLGHGDDTLGWNFSNVCKWRFESQLSFCYELSSKYVKKLFFFSFFSCKQHISHFHKEIWLAFLLLAYIRQNIYVHFIL